MRRSIQKMFLLRSGASGILTLGMALLISGCSGCNKSVEEVKVEDQGTPAPPPPQTSPEEKLMEEQIATLEKITELFESVVNKKSKMADIQLTRRDLDTKLTKLNTDFEAGPQDRKDAARAALGPKLDEVRARMSEAKTKAYNVKLPAPAE
jgi:PBP1b-binding outer membrane lipoprotein LpoB